MRISSAGKSSAGKVAVREEPEETAPRSLVGLHKLNFNHTCCAGHRNNDGCADRMRARLEVLLKANAAPRCSARSKRTGKRREFITLLAVRRRDHLVRARSSQLCR